MKLKTHIEIKHLNQSLTRAEMSETSLSNRLAVIEQQRRPCTYALKYRML